MPYTPPSRRSPVSSNNASPAITRNHSYDKSVGPTSRPEIPRSRSATYLQKHRRTPSLSDNKPSHDDLITGVSYSDGLSTVATGNSSHETMTNSLLGSRFHTSPIDTAGSSEEEEDRGRRRQIADLAETLRDTMVSNKRQRSPDREERGRVQVISTGGPAPLIIQTSVSSLTPEAIKIVHSRSNSELLSVPANAITISELSSSGDSDDDGLEMRRIPLLRKKSGELVKPALRASSRKRPMSAPGTPTHAKAVHFHENIEQVRHFLQIDKPMAVSAESSPVETYESESDYPFGHQIVRKPRTSEWEIKLENFPQESHERKCLPVRLEQINLAPDGKTLVCLVAVANIAFQKWVFARFTYDYWKTTSEIAAEWTDVRPSGVNDGYDRFQFIIKLSEQANLQNKTLLICVRYNAGGQEHWDSNFGKNYQVDFLRKTPKSSKSSSPSGPSPGAVPRSRKTTNTLTRPRSFPAGNSDDEFSTRRDSPFRLKSKLPGDRSKNHTFQDSTAQHHSGNRLSNRYDFTSSLTAALATAQHALGDRSGLKITLPTGNQRPVSAPVTAPITAPVTPPVPIKITAPARVAPPVLLPVSSAASSSSATTSTTAPVSNAPRPTLGSVEYQALIQKFCYFGSGGNTTAVTSPEPEKIEAKIESVQTTTTTDPTEDSSESNVSSANSSASHSPPSPKVHLHQTDAESPSPSKPSTRTPSPSVRTLSPRLLPYRTPSPALSAYQEFPHQGLSVQSAQC